MYCFQKVQRNWWRIQDSTLCDIVLPCWYECADLRCFSCCQISQSSFMPIGNAVVLLTCVHSVRCWNIFGSYFRTLLIHWYIEITGKFGLVSSVLVFCLPQAFGQVVYCSCSEVSQRWFIGRFPRQLHLVVCQFDPEGSLLQNLLCEPMQAKQVICSLDFVLSSFTVSSGVGSSLLLQPLCSATIPKKLLLPFYGHFTAQPTLAGTAVKNWKILLEQSFSARMPLLMATSTFGLGRRLLIGVTCTVFVPYWYPRRKLWICIIGAMPNRLCTTTTVLWPLFATPSGLTSAYLHLPPIFFTGRMPFLPPNQQHQSTEGTQIVYASLINVLCDVHDPVLKYGMFQKKLL